MSPATHPDAFPELAAEQAHLAYTRSCRDRMIEHRAHGEARVEQAQPHVVPKKMEMADAVLGVGEDLHAFLCEAGGDRLACGRTDAIGRMHAGVARIGSLRMG